MGILYKNYKKLRIFLGVASVLELSGMLTIHSMDHTIDKAHEAHEEAGSLSSEIVMFEEKQEIALSRDLEDEDQEELHEWIKRFKDKPEKKGLLQWLLKMYNYYFQSSADAAPPRDIFGNTLIYGDSLGAPGSMRPASTDNVSASSLRSPRRNSSWSGWLTRIIHDIRPGSE
jgi:hypothetical protein